MVHKASYGTTVIRYSVSISDRKTLAIEVHPDLSVRVIAPKGSSQKDIREKILKRARWIRKHQRYFEEFLPRTPRREYVSGESHYYLGRRYILRVRKSAKRSVKLVGPDLIVLVEKPNDVAVVKSLLATWYYRHAQGKFQQSLNDALSKFKRHQMNVPPMIIRRMSKRWGSCTPTGKIILNPEIIESSSKCIEYVVTHELCHLVYPNHGAAFHQLQDEVMPEWRKWKMRLEKMLS
jgi:predicted metal-dependent hydrolase